MSITTTIAIIEQHRRARPDAAVTMAVGECPKCGKDRPIRAFKERRQCGNCGHTIVGLKALA
jgi:hypothetical protein